MTTIFRADLHCHSTYSDGQLSPEELIDLAKKVGLSGLSITDHDTIEAYDTILPYARDAKIDIISGVEFSSIHEGVSVHILGYSFSLDSSAILNLCERHRERRIKRCRAILELLSKNHMPLDQQEIFEMHSHGCIGRPHIALAMRQKGYVKTMKDAFRKYLTKGKPGYVESGAFSAEETIETIHEGGGLAIIAHPSLLKPQNAIKDLMELDFDGIEAYYARFGKAENQHWKNIAEKKGWLVTGGSDFHGEAKPQISFGCSWVNEETFDILKQHFHHSQPCPLGQGNDLSGRGLDPAHPNFEKTPPLREGSPNASPRREDE